MAAIIMVGATSVGRPAAAEPADHWPFPGKALHDSMNAAALRGVDAAAADPQSVTAQLDIAEWYTALWCYGLAHRDESQSKARAAAERAAELDMNNAAARTALGVSLWADWQWLAARTHLEAAIRIDPRNAKSRQWYALYLASMRETASSIIEANQAVQLEPSVGNRVGRSAVHYFARDFPQMEQDLAPLARAHPENGIVRDWLGMALVGQAKFDEAITTYREANRLSEGLAEIQAGLGHALAMAGQPDEAKLIRDRLQRLDTKMHIPPVQIAFIHVGLGDKSAALDHLERAQMQKSWELVFILVEPWLDSLRDEPRFRAIQSAMAFPNHP